MGSIGHINPKPSSSCWQYFVLANAPSQSSKIVAMKYLLPSKRLFWLLFVLSPLLFGQQLHDDWQLGGFRGEGNRRTDNLYYRFNFDNPMASDRCRRNHIQINLDLRINVDLRKKPAFLYKNYNYKCVINEVPSLAFCNDEISCPIFKFHCDKFDCIATRPFSNYFYFN